MSADALDHARALVHADRETRDIALFRSAEDVLRSLYTHYVPPEPPRPLDGLRGMAFDAVRQLCARDSVAARSFGEFRDAVLTHEERCAQRLGTLRGTAIVLSRLASDAPDPERVAGMLGELAQFVATRWRLDLPLDDGPTHRSWALRVSRRYDLLPPTWRTL